jgi:phage terminase large subunit
VYGHLIQAMKARGQLEEFEHERDGVFAVMDLGISDSFAIWWFRMGPNRGVDIVDHYEAHGRPLSHYFDVLDGRGFKYTKLFLPHDARARSLQTGISVQDMFMARYPGLAAIGPELSVADGLQAARWMFEQETTRIHPRCSLITGPEDIDGVEALRCYKFEYDEERKVYKKTPLHDWSSHSADAVRGMALVVKFSEIITRPKPVAEPVVEHGLPTFSLPPRSSIRSPGRGRF